MQEIDKTKANIKVGDLDEGTRKELFNKFVDAGGKVVKEKRNKPKPKFDRERQKKVLSQLEEKQKARANTNPKKNYPQYTASGKKEESSYSIFNMINIHLHLKFMGISDYYGIYMKPNFMFNLDHEYKSALIELQTIYYEIFKQEMDVSNQIINKLDQYNPLYYDLIEGAADLYDNFLFNQILDNYINFPEIPQMASEIRTPLTEIFKRLYLIGKYSEQLYWAFEKSIDQYVALKRIKPSVFSGRKRKIKNDIYIIFVKLYPRLFWLFCNFNQVLFLKGSMEIEKALNINEEDKPGQHKRGNKNDQPQVNVIGTDEEAEEKAIPVHIKHGLDLMYVIDYENLRIQYDKNGYFKNIHHTDKMFLTYLLFQEFDHEYSFILTTNKIKFGSKYATTGKVDYKIKLADLYNEMHHCSDSLHEYILGMENYEKTRGEKPTSRGQFLEYSRRLTSLEKSRKDAGHIARDKVFMFMKKIAAELKTIILDMNTNNAIIQNPQDMLTFDQGIEGEHKMDNKKIYEAILTAYYFASAFSYRLEPGNDLSGPLEFKEINPNNDTVETGSSASAQQTNAAIKENQPTIVSNKMKSDDIDSGENPESKSIIDEMERLI